jgi:hypothetical protein
MDRSVGSELDVVYDPDAVTQALGAAELEGLPDRGQAEGLAGVDRDVEVLAADVVERLEVARRRIALLRSGDVEPDDARVAPPDGAFGNLDRSGELAHRGDEDGHHDRPAGRGGPFRPDPEALEVRLDDLVERQTTLRRELRRVADLGVDHAVGGEVLSALRGDPNDRVALLEHADRVSERLEVQLERLAVGAAADPCRELVGIGRRQPVVAELGREVDDRGGPQPAVEVVVEQRLGRLADRFEPEHRPSRWVAPMVAR